jgi:hypothetical protein
MTIMASAVAGDNNVTADGSTVRVVVNWSTAGFGHALEVFVPVALSPRKADRFIREAVAADILAVGSITIDPDDIYFPMTN